MKVLIVGGAGYVGGALTDILASSKHEVKVYDALLYENSYLKKVPFVYGDLRDHKKLLPLLKWADAVVWLAAIVGDGACAINPEISSEVNEDGVKWLAKNFDGRIIFMSTCSVYGAQDGVLDESSPTNPLSIYAVTKLGAEKYLKNKNALIFRLGTLFGLGDTYSRIRFDLVLNTLVARAYTEGKLKVFGGEQWRPLLHVRDAAQACADNLMTDYKGTYNLHFDNVRIKDLAEKVQSKFDNVELEVTEMKFEDSRNYKASSDKARSEIAFKPKYNIEDGIMEIKALLEDNRIKDINNPAYSNQAYLQMFNTHHFNNGDDNGK